jgi:septation ring formation regulator EzrA
MKTTEKELKAVLAKIEKSKEVISKERDKLREIYSELEMCLESFDEGIEGLENGKGEIETALDVLSQFV